MSKLADVTTLEEIKDIIAKVVAEKNEKGEVLTAEVLNNTYYNLVKNQLELGS